MENNTIEKIDKFLIEGPMYGKQKSKLWKKYREEIFDAKNKRVLTKLMAKIEKDASIGNLLTAEMMDLVDKIDQKAVNMDK